MINDFELAQLAADSYRFQTFSVAECEVWVSYRDGVQVIAARGTEIDKFITGSGWVDVLRDVRMLPWFARATGWAHAGFLKGGRRLAAGLSEYLKDDVPIVLTGHSLGGALSLVAGLFLLKRGYTVDSWVGFASPRALIFNRQLPFECRNYRNANDIVPTIPWSFPIPFRHQYDVVQLGNGNGRLSLDDHSVKNYIRAMRERKIK